MNSAKRNSEASRFRGRDERGRLRPQGRQPSSQPCAPGRAAASTPTPGSIARAGQRPNSQTIPGLGKMRPKIQMKSGRWAKRGGPYGRQPTTTQQAIRPPKPVTSYSLIFIGSFDSAPTCFVGGPLVWAAQMNSYNFRSRRGLLCAVAPTRLARCQLGTERH